MATYYELLGVEKTADEESIRSAYRKKAFHYHPDRNQDDPEGAEKKFKEYSHAYDVLTTKRAEYDEWLKNPTKPRTPKSATPAPQPFTRPFRPPENVWREAFRAAFGFDWQPTFATGDMKLGEVYQVRPGPQLGVVNVKQPFNPMGGSSYQVRPVHGAGHPVQGQMPEVRLWRKKGKRKK